MSFTDKFVAGFLAPCVVTKGLRGRHGIRVRTLPAGAILGALLPSVMSLALAAESPAKPLRVSSTATNEVPPTVASGELKIAVVRQLNTGDYYEQWISGLENEAQRLGIKPDIYNADGDNARQALYLQQAVAAKPDAIIVGWGLADNLRAGLDAARDAAIPIIAYYVVQIEPSKDVAIVEQDDRTMMAGVLKQLETSNYRGISLGRRLIGIGGVDCAVSLAGEASGNR